MDGYQYRPIQFRDYQEEGLQALWSYFMTHKGNPILAWPTGTGKSLVPAEFIRRTMVHYPNQRFGVVTHVKELIQQNFDKLIGTSEQAGIWPSAPAGVYSAGLKRKNIHDPIIYGGIQSMYRHPDYFGHRDILFIDEAHLLSPDDTTMYHKLISVWKQINPHLKIIGMSATPYRMGQGLLTDGGLFTHIAHNLTDLENFNKLVADGYLAPLVTKRTETKLDISQVDINKGEFNLTQLQHESDKSEITWAALQEMAYYGQNRRSWLIYATGIEHANHIAEMLGKLGIECASVHSKQSDDYNTAALKAHKELRLRAIVSFSKLTTGLDHPAVDLIGMLRATLSVPLWVQMLGRGTRIEEGKQNCMVLDYARNAERLGPINDPVLPRKKGDKTGDIPIKICENCGTYHHISVRVCDVCGTPFEFEIKFKKQSADVDIIREPEAVQVEVFDVSHVIYNRKDSRNGKSPYLKITYFSGINGFDEYQYPESSYRKYFVDWWRQRSTLEPPHFIDDVMRNTAGLRKPRRIRVHVNRRYNGRPSPEVLGVEF